MSESGAAFFEIRMQFFDSERDLSGSRRTLFQGETSSFVPEPASLVVSKVLGRLHRSWGGSREEILVMFGREHGSSGLDVRGIELRFWD